MKHKIVFLCGIIMTLSVTSLIAYAALKNGKDSKYEYRISPGTEEWAKYNHSERVDLSQIPDDVIANMSTEELLDAVLEYPCFLDMMFYDTYSIGFDVVRNHFGALDTLLKREDIASKAFEKYMSIDLDAIKNIDDEYESFLKKQDIFYLEAIISQEEVFGALSTDAKEILLERMMLYNSELETNSYFIDELIGSGNSVNSYYTTVNTPNGTSIQVIVVTGSDYEYINRNSIKTSIENAYPGVQVVGDATNRYNCHAFAWPLNTSVWMNDPSMYWLDGSYYLAATNGTGVAGQRVFYPVNNNQHSGLVQSSSGNNIVSKWGAQSVVRHSLSNCPYYYAAYNYYYYER